MGQGRAGLGLHYTGETNIDRQQRRSDRAGQGRAPVADGIAVDRNDDRG